MSDRRGDAAHWFARAAELRTLAAPVADPETKRKILDLADIARRSPARRKSSPKRPRPGINQS